MKSENDIKLGKKIQKLRKNVHLTQEQLAEKLKLSTKYVQFIESGDRKPSLKTIYKVARALNVRVQELFPF
ncbi:helix-turn-helix transcriptional regulator [Candidatus Curtissbacteria bacterium]|nr:helix-turn-helix transcriptional regulator [Candidatus Curtissbacteria bacterium]